MQNSIRKRSYYLLLLANFFFFLALSVYFLFPIHIKDLGGSRTDIGTIMGSFGISSVFMILYVGSILDRMSKKIFLFSGAFLIIIASISYTFLTQLSPLFYILRTIQGAGFSLYFPAVGVLTTSVMSKDKQIQVLGYLGIAGLLSYAVGPFAGEYLISIGGFSLLFYFSAASAFASIILTAFVKEERAGEAHKETDSSGIFKLFFSKPLLNLFSFTILLGASFASIVCFVSVFAKSKGIENISLFFTSYTVSGILLRLILAKFIDRLDASRVIIFLSILFVCSILIFIFVDSKTMLIITGLIFGASHGLIHPPLNHLVLMFVNPLEKGKGMSLYSWSFNLGIVAGMPLFGIIADYGGYGFMYKTAAVLMTLGIIIFLPARKNLLQNYEK